MSDGRVGLILDTQGIAQRANVLQPASDTPVHTSEREAPASAIRYLIAASRDGGQFAIPLESVDRLEELDPNHVEIVGVREVVQYRGGILPLVRLRNALEERRKVPRDTLPPVDQISTIVCSSGGKRLGVVVDRIIDVVDDDGGVIGPSTRRGVAGTIVALGKIAELVDLLELAKRLDLAHLVEAP